MISEGRTAILYPLPDQKIIKVLKRGLPHDWLELEYRISQYINKVGIPTPKVFGIHSVEDKTGLVFERIDGPSLFTYIKHHPHQFKEVGILMAKLHAHIHSKAISHLPLQKLRLSEAIEAVSEALLSNEKKRVILSSLISLPEGNQICHGDFHPLNVLTKAEDDYVVIDWITATVGDAACDVARTLFMLNYAELPDDVSVDFRNQFQQTRQQLACSYLDHYIELTGMRVSDIKKWDLPVMAARLNENLPIKEKHTLLEMINQRIETL